MSEPTKPKFDAIPLTPPAAKSEPAAKPPDALAKPTRSAWVAEVLRLAAKPTKQKGVVAAGLMSLVGGAAAAKLLMPTRPTPDTSLYEVADNAKSSEAAPLPPATVPPSTPPVEKLDIPLPPPVLPPPILPLPIVAETLTVPEFGPPYPHAAVVGGIVGQVPLYDLRRAEVPPRAFIATTAVVLANAFDPPSLPLPGATPPPPPSLGDLALPNLNLPPLAAPLPPPGGTQLAPPTLPEAQLAPPTLPPPSPVLGTPPTSIKIEPAIKFEEVPLRPALPAPASPPPAPLKITPVSQSMPEARTSFDVDVHEIRSGDTYASISKKYLGDDRYADAIRAYNKEAALTAGATADIPPIHVLRKKFATLVSRPAEWAPAAATPGGKTYEVPAGGITLKGIAKLAYGDEIDWTKIWNLNLQRKPDEVLPEGTIVRVPDDARVGK